MGKIAFDLLSITGAGNAVNNDKLREVSLQKVGVCQVIGSDMYAFGKTVSAGVQAIDRGSVQGKLGVRSVEDCSQGEKTGWCVQV